MVYLQRWHGWCHVKLLPCRRVLCTPHNHVPWHVMQSHLPNVHTCLAVTCHLHFRQNGRDLLRDTAITRGWNGYRNKSQHRKFTLDKKILPPLLQGLEPATLQSRSTHTHTLLLITRGRAHVCVCVCVRACVRSCVRACVCVYLHACTLSTLRGGLYKWPSGSLDVLLCYHYFCRFPLLVF